MRDVQILEGDVLETLQAIESGTVRTSVTSPPYYGLRDYGTADWRGGDPECKHNPQRADGGDRADRSLPLGRGGVYRDVCSKCGAVRVDNQIGLEKTPEEYVDKLVRVFREVWRVLADDGTLWLNLGDTYASAWAVGRRSTIGAGSLENGKRENRPNRLTGDLKEKDLIGIPWMVAFALRADGWYLRSDIIWHKPNPMPESVKDRPTRAHEYIFLFSKSRKYYYDHEAIKEPITESSVKRLSQPNFDNQTGGPKDPRNGGDGSRNRSARQGLENLRKKFDKSQGGDGRILTNRNKRDVWTVTTKPYREAHFATFPPDLIEPCILAGSARGDTVLDPFGGSGTTAEAALRYGRKVILCELNGEYIQLIQRRLSKVQIELDVK